MFAICPAVESFVLAVVDIKQAAPLQLLEHRQQRLRRRLELGAHVIGDADIAGIARHQPLQPLHVLLGRQRGEERMRARIHVGIVVGLERDLQQHLMAVGAGPRHPVLEAAPIGPVGDADRRRQALDHVARGPSGRPRPVTRMATRGGASGGGRGRVARGPRIHVDRTPSVCRHLRQRPVLRFLDQFGDGHRRKGDRARLGFRHGSGETEGGAAARAPLAARPGRSAGGAAPC